MTKPIGETTITGKNQVSLPAPGQRDLGGARGDHLVVHVIGSEAGAERVLLAR
ncbi:MAG: hypothetical protein QOF51_4161 [Chloroflexota bacterium]|nr:hypothetical protein [Chloroflexota bacterium]